jgi:transcriptional regulator with XRE-family HTH domain
MENKKTVPIEFQLFATHFKLARIAAGLRQCDLQEETGLTRQYLSELERQVVNIGIDSMARIAQALEIPLYRMLMPQFSEQYDFVTNTEWLSYQPLIDNSLNIPFERKVFSENFRKSRMDQGYLQKDVIELSGLSKVFLIAVERAACSISLDNALKLAHLVNLPLSQLLKPTALIHTTASPTIKIMHPPSS